MSSSPFVAPALGGKMRFATVRIWIGDTHWTGAIVGKKYGQTLIITVAHVMTDTARWMGRQQFEAGLKVNFYGDPNPYPCRILRSDGKSDVMLLLVAKEFGRVLKFAPESQWNLREAQHLGARGHPVGAHAWSLTEGPVVNPSIMNTHNFMTNLDSEMEFFEHRLPMSKGFSGAVLLNVDGDIVGLQSGTSSNAYTLMGTQPLEEALGLRIRAIQSSKQTPELIMKELEDPRVNLGGLAYGRNDIHRLETLPGHAISFAVHVRYLKRILLGGGGYWGYWFGLQLMGFGKVARHAWDLCKIF
ncbi:hypothetical protein ACET3Z_030316 [Daucus carota]